MPKFPQGETKLKIFVFQWRNNRKAPVPNVTVSVDCRELLDKTDRSGEVETKVKAGYYTIGFDKGSTSVKRAVMLLGGTYQLEQELP